MQRLPVLNGEQLLERALADRAELAARPRPTPRQVLGVWLENAGAGLGAAILVGAGLYWLGAPFDPLYMGGMAGALVFGGAMVISGTNDERKRLKADRDVRQAVRIMAADADAEVARMAAQLQAAIDALDAADDEIAAGVRSLDAMIRERDMAVYDLSRERQAQAGGKTYVPPVEMTPQEISDATEMIRYRYQFGAHLSRRKADEGKRWSQPRWEAAQKELAAARVIAVVNGVTEYPATQDEALERLGEYMIHARGLSAPAVNRAVGFSLYVEPETP